MMSSVRLTSNAAALTNKSTAAQSANKTFMCVGFKKKKPQKKTHKRKKRSVRF